MVNTEMRLITFFVAKDVKAVHSQQKQVRELTMTQIIRLLIEKFRLKLKKAGETTRPVRYDLNQIPLSFPDSSAGKESTCNAR